MIVDVFTYNGEADLLEIRLNILNAYVDQFIIVEAPVTFSGKPKPLYYEKQKERFKKWKDKITYFVIDTNYSEEEIAQAESSPNTVGAKHWKNEFLQKESIKKALTHLNDDDIVFIGDVDEIWQWGQDESAYKALKNEVWKLKLRVYTYYLNNRSSEEFWGPIVTRYANIKNSCLNHLRTQPTIKTKDYYGWHFTSMGGLDEMKRKLTDSYTAETYANEWVMSNLENNHGHKDFLGRDFIYTIDESEWPQYLKDNKEKYKHLCK